MTMTKSMILCLLVMARSCQLQCVKETPKDTEFSINVTTHIKAESSHCIWIEYQFTFPTNKVTIPYKKIWFKGDPQNTVSVKTVDSIESGTTDTFTIDGLPPGEHEYGFKLEWKCNETYIFPKRVWVSVSALTKRPVVWAPPMREGQPNSVICSVQKLCSRRPTVYWNWTKADGSTWHHHNSYRSREILRLTPTADDHNSNITCVVDYGYDVVKTTITLTVKFPPKILNGSQCRIEGKLLVCVCISRGNPLSPVTWPLASLTDFSVTSFSSIQTVNSTVTMPAADYHNTTVKCISSNKLGQAEIEMPLQKYTDSVRLNDWSDRRQKPDATLPWIIAGLSFGLNLVLLGSLIVCAYKRGKRVQEEGCEEMNTYTSLKRADVGQEYSVVSPQPR